ncbi:MAG: hypothetical protein HON27_09565 [Candidatus Marinimicrobia bacterium]|jgi:hypothetical protein|nr:hypothetical protein [Candidatus Neomarinimicrobiota bacterium]MBT4946404.1 hypothetical protein [Candidatus Neomarinimicrobiota bacterium]MBT5268572.1 hypothetical protein [Candidatus Neomarinimicrobiota bacterium]MBT6011861.1 hypothetical protein [Candidatus Neomarinimicrobiota bacterium]
MRHVVQVLAIVLVSTFTGCHKPPDPIEERDTRIYLELINTWTTNVTFKISVADTTTNWGFELSRNDSIILYAEVWGHDTTIIDDGLDPSRDYEYTAYFIENTEKSDSSLALTVTTMDTTSHDFVWYVDSLGVYPSEIRDVFIIGPNDIWAVGEIRNIFGSNDSLYGAAHWNGIDWQLFNFNYREYSTIQANGIWMTDEDDIWLANGSILHFDGDTTRLVWRRDLNSGEAAWKAWGSSSNNIFFIGFEGLIVHYNGIEFTRMESNTDIFLNQIAGSDDGEHVFVVGSISGNPHRSILLEFSDGEWNELYYKEGVLPDQGDMGLINGVAVEGDTAYVTTHSGLWKYNYITSESVYIPGLDNFNNIAVTHIRVEAPNDIIYAGASFSYIHYNGDTSFMNREVQNHFTQSKMNCFELKNDIAVIAGFCCSAGHAIIARGYRE